MNCFFLKQLNFNKNIFLKNISTNFNVSLNLLINKYKLNKLDKNFKIEQQPIKIYKNLFIDYNNKYYLVLKDNKLKFNAIVINL